MNIINKYIFKQIISTVLLLAVVFCIAILLSQALKFIDITINQGASFKTFSQLILWSLPKFFVVILPISLVFSVLFIYNKMIVDNEFVIFKSAGLNNLQLSYPSIILALVLGCGVFFLDGWVAPYSKAKIDTIKKDVVQNQSTVFLKENVFNDLGRGLSVYVDKKDNAGNLVDVFIKDKRELETILIAKQGKIINEDNRIVLLLNDGQEQFFNKKTNKLDTLTFSQYFIVLKQKYPTDKLVSLIKKDTDEQSLPDLFKSLKENKITNKQKILSEINIKITSVFLTVSFVLIALSFIFKTTFHRTGHTKQISVCVGLLVVLQALIIGASNYSKTSMLGIYLLYILSISPAIICYYLLIDKGRKNV
jgi:lipopolysaccharide export system permease protein